MFFGAAGAFFELHSGAAPRGTARDRHRSTARSIRRFEFW